MLSHFELPPVLLPSEVVDLGCDCCGTNMIMQRFQGRPGGSFGCPVCKQLWVFNDDTASCTVLHKLFPKMKETSKLYQEYLDYQLAQNKFMWDAKVLCGITVREIADRRIDLFRHKVAEKREQLAKRRWWKFFRQQ